jgi:acyl-CoA thioesterase FadM
MKWLESYKVKFHDTNSNEILGISNVLKFMQETAMLHMKNTRPSYEDLINEGKALILSSIRINMYTPIYAYDNIDVKTWACGSRGFTTTRSFEIYKGDALAYESNSVWALVSTTDKKLLRLSEVDFSNYEEEPPLVLEQPAKVRISNEMKLNLVGEYTVRYSDTDLNGHMNNTNYPDLFFNCLPNPESKLVKSLAISFVNEAKIGDNLRIYMAKSDGKYFMRSLHEDSRVNAEAEFTIENME